jgi:hypothetical protein
MVAPTRAKRTLLPGPNQPLGETAFSNRNSQNSIEVSSL